MIYMRARYMDPVLGKFVSEDPARDGANWYEYCGNNPTNAVDPEGKILWSIMDLLACACWYAAQREYDNVTINIGLNITAGLLTYIGARLTIDQIINGPGGEQFRKLRKEIEDILYGEQRSQQPSSYEKMLGHDIEVDLALSYAIDPDES